MAGFLSAQHLIKEIASPRSQKPLSSCHVREYTAQEFRSLLERIFASSPQLYGMGPQKGFDLWSAQLARKIRPLIISVPKTEHLINQCFSIFFYKYGLQNLKDMSENFEDILDKQFYPCPLLHNQFAGLISVLKKRDDKTKNDD